MGPRADARLARAVPPRGGARARGRHRDRRPRRDARGARRPAPAGAVPRAHRERGAGPVHRRRRRRRPRGEARAAPPARVRGRRRDRPARAVGRDQEGGEAALVGARGHLAHAGALARAQKVLSRAGRGGLGDVVGAALAAPSGTGPAAAGEDGAGPTPDERLGRELLALVARAEADGLDAEAALRGELRRVEARIVAAETSEATSAGVQAETGADGVRRGRAEAGRSSRSSARRSPTRGPRTGRSGAGHNRALGCGRKPTIVAGAHAASRVSLPGSATTVRSARSPAPKEHLWPASKPLERARSSTPRKPDRRGRGRPGRRDVRPRRSAVGRVDRCVRGRRAS